MDVDLRGLERAVREGGGPQARVALLRALLRLGTPGYLIVAWTTTPPDGCVPVTMKRVERYNREKAYQVWATPVLDLNDYMAMAHLWNEQHSAMRFDLVDGSDGRCISGSYARRARAQSFTLRDEHAPVPEVRRVCNDCEQEIDRTGECGCDPDPWLVRIREDGPEEFYQANGVTYEKVRGWYQPDATDMDLFLSHPAVFEVMRQSHARAVDAADLEDRERAPACATPHVWGPWRGREGDWQRGCTRCPATEAVSELPRTCGTCGKVVEDRGWTGHTTPVYLADVRRSDSVYCCSGHAPRDGDSPHHE